MQANVLYCIFFLFWRVPFRPAFKMVKSSIISLLWSAFNCGQRFDSGQFTPPFYFEENLENLGLVFGDLRKLK